MGPSLSLWSHLLHLSVLLLLANFNPALCRPGNRDECMDAPFVPGHDLVGEGFDIVKMQRKRAYIIDVQTYLGKDDRCQLCENDEMNNELQKLPLSVVDWRSISKSRFSFSSTVYQSATELVRSTTTQVKNDWKLGLGLEKFGFEGELELGMGRSNMAKFAFQMDKKDLYTFIVHEINCTLYSFRVSNTASLSREFAQDISRLPREYNDKTRPRYKQLINTYGTHYLRQVDLGGRIKTVSAIRTCLASLNSQSTEEIKDCLTAQLSLTFPLGIIDSKVSPKQEVCSSMMNSDSRRITTTDSYVSQITEMVPGDFWVGSLSSSFNDPTGFNIWMDKLKEDPGVVSYSLTSLPMLISDEVIKGNVKTAIQEYLRANPISSQSESYSCKSGKCCPKKTRRGKLMITLRATGLTGDSSMWWHGNTDAFATVAYAGVQETTKIVVSNNPYWNTLNFGEVDIIDPVRVTVYDYDGWRDEELGTCEFDIVSGSNEETKNCFGSSTVTLSYTLTCADYLTGDQCENYLPKHPN